MENLTSRNVRERMNAADSERYWVDVLGVEFDDAMQVTDRKLALVYRWWGGEYVEVSERRHENAPFEVLNVWSQGGDHPYIERTVHALREHVAGLDAETVAEFKRCADELASERIARSRARRSRA